ncbi:MULTISPECIES: hypothetical protein [Mycobacterium avium complex (MAC)]|uniref:Chemotaxis protein n=1 Tax=Mycobacterium intracellulare subsp. chimaera TaxID=222805 RepID=A0ABT7PA94_MYCIT|nr:MULTISPECIES: hypothetical protein [Mycobacterium avium complex (MAC)]AOS94711.1 hypothetical protein AN480_26790 [Mycobacterium intracellulare subsp. chimaera]KPN46278.1 hypothetical protein AN932_24230 [Mycobacterium intracellulare subsp. chimaera]MDM3930214.1 chemotaxis protein [Mycobacterium intracellulare subsp. chimaera]PBA69189.1 chemotaxis protein [Mycobacterium avium]
MSGRVDDAAVFTRWANTVLAGTGYSAATVGHAESNPRDDLATQALADGFAAAAWGLARQTVGGER